jgi:hypothetical protein
MEDARKEGGRWFCSPSCLLQGTAGTWKQKPRRKWRRRIALTLAVVLALFVALVVLGR